MTSGEDIITFSKQDHFLRAIASSERCKKDEAEHFQQHYLSDYLFG
jgi:hypothetical protein